MGKKIISKLLGAFLMAAFVIVAVSGAAKAGGVDLGWTGDNEGPSGEFNYIVVYKDEETAYLLASKYMSMPTTTVSGITYNKATNTITLNNVNQPTWVLETNEMGIDLKLEVKGTCQLGKILVWGFGYGGNLTVTGTGSLTLNANKKQDYAVHMNAELAQGVFTVEPTVAFKAYATDNNPAILSQDSKLENSIIINGLSKDDIKATMDYQYQYKSMQAINVDYAKSSLRMLDKTDGTQYTESTGIYYWKGFDYNTFKTSEHLMKIDNVSGLGKVAYVYKADVDLAAEGLQVRKNGNYDVYSTESFVLSTYSNDWFDEYKDSKGNTVYIQESTWNINGNSTKKYRVVDKVIENKYGKFVLTTVYEEKDFDISKYTKQVEKKIPRYRVSTKINPVVSTKSSAITGSCGTKATYSLNLSTGLMTISGSGDMTDYKYSTRTPWFKYRDKIKKVNITSGITRVGTNTFYGCTNLTEVTGCANVKSIGINTFRNCPILTKVAGCTKCTLVEQYAFCGSNKFSTIGSTAGTVNLPAATKIGGYTFYECKGIKKLVTASVMAYIGTRSFSNCTAMTEVTVGSACKTIGSYAFCGNTSLTKVNGCAGLTGIGDFAFYANGKLTTVAGCTKVANVGKSIFRNCATLTQVGATAGQIKFPAAKAVGEYAFSGCKAAKIIDLGSNLGSIGQYAFQNTSSLTKLYIRSANLTTVEDNAFKGTKATGVTYVPKAKVTAYKNGVLKNKGAVLTIKAI